jgi:hypothetical protein
MLIVPLPTDPAGKPAGKTHVDKDGKTTAVVIATHA